MGEIECTKCLYNVNSKCEIGGWNIPKVGCTDGKAKPITNADKIRFMNDEELATWIYMNRWNDIESLLEWLRQESEGNQ